MELEEINDLPETLRGSGGFGSTGKWKIFLIKNQLKDTLDK